MSNATSRVQPIPWRRESRGRRLEHGGVGAFHAALENIEHGAPCFEETG